MAQVISLCGWERFQHYKDRDPPWVKFYRDLLTSESWVLGTDSSRLLQVASILLAARYSNQIPARYDLIKRVANLDLSERQYKEAIEHLVSTKFLEIQSCPDVKESLAQSASKTLAKCSSEAEQSREETDKTPIPPKGAVADSNLHDQIIATYHEVLPDLPAVRDWPERRRKKLEARIGERLKAGKQADQVSYWRALFTNVQASDFLCGRKSDWRCPGLEWLLEPKNFTKVIEGAYRNNESMNGASHAR